MPCSTFSSAEKNKSHFQSHTPTPTQINTQIHKGTRAHTRRNSQKQWHRKHTHANRCTNIKTHMQTLTRAHIHSYRHTEPPALSHSLSLTHAHTRPPPATRNGWQVCTVLKYGAHHKRQWQLHMSDKIYMQGGGSSPHMAQALERPTGWHIYRAV